MLRSSLSLASPRPEFLKGLLQQAQCGLLVLRVHDVVLEHLGKRGFDVSSHTGPAITHLRHAIHVERLNGVLVQELAEGAAEFG